MADIGGVVEDFGADPQALRFLDEDGPELLPYATLLAGRRDAAAPIRMVEAVYEWQDAPLAYLVDADSVEGESQLRETRRLLAMRGDAPYLGVVAPGRLDVYRIALDRESLPRARVDCGDEEGSKAATFARLSNERPAAAIGNRAWVSNVVLRLLTGSTTRLIEGGISDEDAISLVGRALFTRFLADRGLLPNSLAAEAAGLFDSRDAAKETSDWLDRTFNGDFLPLSRRAFDQLPVRGGALGDVLRRAPDGQLSLGWEEKWGNLDFAHIPVGVLSQAYELYLRDHAPARQRREGGYFTPRPIAELIVRASFRGLERRDQGKQAHVLDPAVGGGMFLLAAFRELVAAHWRSEGKRPDTDALRDILYGQLVGFDINEAALRFAALGLYLLSIELDPDPRPVDKLRFDNLRGRVLHRVTRTGEQRGTELGSLGPLVGDEHAGRYDLVIGNPPWASGTQLPGWPSVRERVEHVARSRVEADMAVALPNEGLDLPFVWRAMEWAKPDGQIAFALHARLLFQQGDGMPVARRALFEAMNVTAVVNGAELRQTNVWPEISAPFCIVFATNARPGADAGFRFVSPRIEKSLNSSGTIRIDALNAEVVSPRQLSDTPDILKTLFRGSKADLGILERIRAEEHPSLEAFWLDRIGATARGHMRGSGTGYQKLRPSSRIRARGDGLPGYDASSLRGLPEITPASLRSMFVDTQALERFAHNRVHHVRVPDVFAGPLAVVHKSPAAAKGRLRVAICEDGAVFNETYYGYSPGPHDAAGLLVRYLALVFGSKLAMWLALVTSGEFGFERDVVEKATLDRLPLPDFDALDEGRRSEVETLTTGLAAGRVTWEDVDRWVAELYRLGQRDLDVIADTLEFNLPFAANTRSAQTPPNDADRARFCEVLATELEPWCDRFGTALAVAPLPLLAMSPWQGVSVRPKRQRHGAVPAGDSDVDWQGLLRAADEAAATEVVLREGSGGLLIGRLAQRRYWSGTQARLLAQRIAWSHLDVLRGLPQR